MARRGLTHVEHRWGRVRSGLVGLAGGPSPAQTVAEKVSIVLHMRSGAVGLLAFAQ